MAELDDLSVKIGNGVFLFVLPRWLLFAILFEPASLCSYLDRFLILERHR